LSEKEQECKVNLVQGVEGWKTPEESWMDMEEAGDEVYFVYILLGASKTRQTQTRRWRGR
jgi:hypothetical protein